MQEKPGFPARPIGIPQDNEAFLLRRRSAGALFPADYSCFRKAATASSLQLG